MNTNINDILTKLRIKTILDLTEEERKTYQEWEKVLNKQEVTMQELKEFIEGQMAIATEKFLSYKNTEKKDLFLKAQLRNYKSILAFIQSPAINKEFLENHIKQLN